MHFMYGEIYRSEGNYLYANMEYRRALQYDTTATILKAIGESYRRMGKDKNATDYFEKALKLDPNDDMAKYNVLDLYMKELRYEDAIPILEDYLEKEPDNTDYLQRLAECYRSIGEYESSLSVLDRLIEIHPNNPWPYVYAAEIMLEDDRIAEAAPYLEKVARRIPPNNELYEFWIRSLFESKNIDGMLSALEFWLEQEPETLAPYFLYIDYNYQIKDFEKGDRALSLIKDRWREDSRVSYFQGISAMARQETDSVWYYFERADKQGNAGIDLYLYYGLWYWEHGYLDTAEEIADRAIFRMGPGSRWLHMKAMIKAQKYEYHEAEDLLIRLLAADPGNVNAKEDLANIYVEMDQPEETDSLYRELLEDLPGNKSLLNNYAYALSRLNVDLGRAMDMVNKALKKEKNAAYFDTKAWILYRQQKYKKAFSWVKKALEYDDVSADVLYHKGRILQALNKPEEARKAFEGSLNIDPDFRQSRNALEEIK